MARCNKQINSFLSTSAAGEIETPAAQVLIKELGITTVNQLSSVSSTSHEKMMKRKNNILIDDDSSTTDSSIVWITLSTPRGFAIPGNQSQFSILLYSSISFSISKKKKWQTWKTFNFFYFIVWYFVMLFVNKSIEYDAHEAHDASIYGILLPYPSIVTKSIIFMKFKRKRFN